MWHWSLPVLAQTHSFQKITINSSIVETSRTIGPFRPSWRGESIGQHLFTFNSIKMTKLPLNSSVFSSEQHLKKKLIGWINSFPRLKHIYQIKFIFWHFFKNAKILKRSDRNIFSGSILTRTHITTLIIEMSTKD
jgi:hypothetical protein